MARQQPKEGLVLRSERVILRDKRPEDAWNDYVWRADPELAELDATYPLTISYDEFRRFYMEDLRHPQSRSYRFAIDTVEGPHIGNCMYYDLDSRKGEAELGILIGDRAYWSQGYGEEAVTLLVNHMFEDVGLRRVYLKTLDWNIRAQRCFRKCGFVHYGQSRRHQRDFMLMDITREAWEARDPTHATTREYPSPAFPP